MITENYSYQFWVCECDDFRKNSRRPGEEVKNRGYYLLCTDTVELITVELTTVALTSNLIKFVRRGRR